GPRDYNHYCEMMEEASNNGVLPSVFLQEYYDVLHKNLNDIVWPRLKEMFMKHRENVDSFFSLVDSCDKPQEKANFLFSHHQWLCMVEMTKYHFESAQLRYNSVARILARTEKEIANLKAVGL
ncbi:MAG: hypothetical protein KDD45_18320, partial [Bdellovibrionales bacterium]|nr:hypothetical protein [Bdellovibrionales bacterium]